MKSLSQALKAFYHAELPQDATRPVQLGYMALNALFLIVVLGGLVGVSWLIVK